MQTIDGETLINKWEITPQIFLYIVKKQLIDAYAPDQDAVVNETEDKLEDSLGFYSEENETDEDRIARFRFKQKDIIRFEKIAEGYQTST